MRGLQWMLTMHSEVTVGASGAKHLRLVANIGKLGHEGADKE